MTRRTSSFALSAAVFWIAHAVSATAVACVLALIFGGLSSAIAVVSLVVSWFRARRFMRVMQNKLEWRAHESLRPWSTIEIAIFAFTMFAAWKHFAWMIPNMPGANGGALTTLSATNYGDLPLHVNFIRALASGLDFMPVNPIFAAEPLRYPFGPDLYNALWEVLGMPMSAHLFATGCTATFATLVLLRELGGAWAMAAFFLAGGSVVANGPAALDWKNFFLAIWITQRGMLWALPMGLILLLYLRPHLSGEVRLPRRAVSGMGRMWAFFPLFHAHSFVVVSILLFVLTWRDFGVRKTPQFLKRFFFENRALAWALIPAALLIWHTSAGFSKASIVHFRTFWLMPEGSSFDVAISWFLKNFGRYVFAFSATGTALLAAKKFWLREDEPRRRSSLDEFLLLLAFFILFLFVMLAPWDWDNIKVLIWPWILLFGLLGRSFLRVDEVKPSLVWPVVTWIGICAAFVPGVTVIAESWRKPQEKSVTVWTTEQLAFAETALQRVPKKAIFASATTPTHALTYFGRVRAVGYPGHLWSHAIDYRAQEQDLDTLMNGTDGWVDAAKRLKVTHIYWGPEERLQWGAKNSGKSPEWCEKLPLIAASGGHEIYEFKETR